MSKLRKSAKGKQCTLTLFPYCDWVEENVVLCHLSSDSSGISRKSEDWFAVYACASCHDIIDGRRQQDQISDIELEQQKQRALHRTWTMMIEEGLIKV